MGEYDDEIPIFTNDRGEPYHLFIHNCPEKERIAEMIDYGFGTVENNPSGENTLVLAAPGFIAGDDEVFSLQYIISCYSRKKKLNIKDFRLNKVSKYNKDFNPMDVLEGVITWSEAEKYRSRDHNYKANGTNSSSLRSNQRIERRTRLICDDNVSKNSTVHHKNRLEAHTVNYVRSKRSLNFNYKSNGMDSSISRYKQRIEKENGFDKSISESISMLHRNEPKTQTVNSGKHKRNRSYLRRKSEELLSSSDEDSGDDNSGDDNSMEMSIKRKYTRSEQEAIIKCIILHKAYNLVNGKDFWKMMEDKMVCKKRKWQSMKEQFHKKILPNIQSFRLSENQITMFKNMMKNEKKKLHKKYPKNTINQQTTDLQKKHITSCVGENCVSSDATEYDENKECFHSNTNYYTKAEDIALLDFIVARNKFSEVGGVQLWKLMERKQVVPGRSWQSMKERYRKVLVKKFDDYLPSDVVQKIKKTQTGVKRVTNKKRKSCQEVKVLSSQNHEVYGFGKKTRRKGCVCHSALQCTCCFQSTCSIGTSCTSSPVSIASGSSNNIPLQPNVRIPKRKLFSQKKFPAELTPASEDEKRRQPLKLNKTDLDFHQMKLSSKTDGSKKDTAISIVPSEETVCSEKYVCKYSESIASCETEAIIKERPNVELELNKSICSEVTCVTQKCSELTLHDLDMNVMKEDALGESSKSDFVPHTEVGNVEVYHNVCDKVIPKGVLAQSEVSSASNMGLANSEHLQFDCQMKKTNEAAVPDKNVGSSEFRKIVSDNNTSKEKSSNASRNENASIDSDHTVIGKKLLHCDSVEKNTLCNIVVHHNNDYNSSVKEPKICLVRCDSSPYLSNVHATDKKTSSESKVPACHLDSITVNILEDKFVENMQLNQSDIVHVKEKCERSLQEGRTEKQNIVDDLGKNEIYIFKQTPDRELISDNGEETVSSEVRGENGKLESSKYESHRLLHHPGQDTCTFELEENDTRSDTQIITDFKYVKNSELLDSSNCEENDTVSVVVQEVDNLKIKKSNSNLEKTEIILYPGQCSTRKIEQSDQYINIMETSGSEEIEIAPDSEQGSDDCQQTENIKSQKLVIASSSSSEKVDRYELTGNNERKEDVSDFDQDIHNSKVTEETESQGSIDILHLMENIEQCSNSSQLTENNYSEESISVADVGQEIHNSQQNEIGNYEEIELITNSMPNIENFQQIKNGNCEESEALADPESYVETVELVESKNNAANGVLKPLNAEHQIQSKNSILFHHNKEIYENKDSEENMLNNNKFSDNRPREEGESEHGDVLIERLEGQEPDGILNYDNRRERKRKGQCVNGEKMPHCELLGVENKRKKMELTPTNTRHDGQDENISLNDSDRGKCPEVIKNNENTITVSSKVVMSDNEPQGKSFGTKTLREKSEILCNNGTYKMQTCVKECLTERTLENIYDDKNFEERVESATELLSDKICVSDQSGDRHINESVDTTRDTIELVGDPDESASLENHGVLDDSGNSEIKGAFKIDGTQDSADMLYERMLVDHISNENNTYGIKLIDSLKYENDIFINGLENTLNGKPHEVLNPNQIFLSGKVLEKENGSFNQSVVVHALDSEEFEDNEDEKFIAENQDQVLSERTDSFIQVNGRKIGHVSNSTKNFQQGVEEKEISRTLDDTKNDVEAFNEKYMFRSVSEDTYDGNILHKSEATQEVPSNIQVEEDAKDDSFKISIDYSHSNIESLKYHSFEEFLGKSIDQDEDCKIASLKERYTQDVNKIDNTGSMESSKPDNGTVDDCLTNELELFQQNHDTQNTNCHDKMLLLNNIAAKSNFEINDSRCEVDITNDVLSATLIKDDEDHVKTLFNDCLKNMQLNIKCIGKILDNSVRFIPNEFEILDLPKKNCCVAVDKYDFYSSKDEKSSDEGNDIIRISLADNTINRNSFDPQEKGIYKEFQNNICNTEFTVSPNGEIYDNLSVETFNKSHASLAENSVNKSLLCCNYYENSDEYLKERNSNFEVFDIPVENSILHKTEKSGNGQIIPNEHTCTDYVLSKSLMKPTENYSKCKKRKIIKEKGGNKCASQYFKSRSAKKSSLSKTMKNDFNTLQAIHKKITTNTVPKKCRQKQSNNSLSVAKEMSDNISQREVSVAETAYSFECSTNEQSNVSSPVAQNTLQSLLSETCSPAVPSMFQTITAAEINLSMKGLPLKSPTLHSGQQAPIGSFQDSRQKTGVPNGLDTTCLDHSYISDHKENSLIVSDTLEDQSLESIRGSSKSATQEECSLETGKIVEISCKDTNSKIIGKDQDIVDNSSTSNASFNSNKEISKQLKIVKHCITCDIGLNIEPRMQDFNCECPTDSSEDFNNSEVHCMLCTGREETEKVMDPHEILHSKCHFIQDHEKCSYTTGKVNPVQINKQKVCSIV